MYCLIDEKLPQWKGNLHTHTRNSDGRKEAADVVKLYEEAGYDFLALTDHRKVTDPAQFDTSVLLIPGIELDYFITNRHRQAVHLVGVGVEKGIMDFPGIMENPENGIRAVLSQQGAVILAHPAWSLNEPDVIARLKDRGVCATEIFNNVSQPPWNADRADSSSILDLCNGDGCCLPVVGGDDAHFYNGDACGAFLMISAETLSQESVLDALKNGRVYASQGPRIESAVLENGVFTVRCSPAEQIIFYSNMPWVGGRCRREHHMTESSYELNLEKETFIRAEITDAQGRKAWTSPIQLK
ncbi:MAG: CehA/McbA family metallohydrolase [Clostridia bacterium]|nr:CehA/McbA family metallohydrolase [Clostridia bacterium]